MPATRRYLCVGLSRWICALGLSAWVVSAGADPRIDYLLHCGGCHLADGSGAPPEVPTLKNELGRLLSIDAGRDYLARVPGASQAPISDEALTQVLNWVLVEFNQETLPQGFKPLSTREVKRSRARVLADPLKFRAKFWSTDSNSESY